MRWRICPSDGYVMEGHQSLGSPNVDWTCKNPWHPQHPGACPKCGSKGNHRLAGIGMKEARCIECGREWDSRLPFSRD